MMRNSGSKSLNNLPEVTVLVSNRATIQTRLNMPNGINYLLPKPVPPTLFSISVGGLPKLRGIHGASLFSHPNPIHEEVYWLYL